MKITTMVIALILFTGAFFQVAAQCVTTKSVGPGVEWYPDEGIYKKYDSETRRYYEAEKVAKSDGTVTYEYTKKGEKDREKYVERMDRGGDGGGGGDSGGGH